MSRNPPNATCPDDDATSLACCQLGLRVIDFGSAPPETFPVTDLSNASHPSARYDAIRFTGGPNEPPYPTITLPTPATNDDAYEITIENRSTGTIVITSGTAAKTVALARFLGVEISLESEIADIIATETAHTYRTRVLVTPQGAERVPGFTSAPD